MALYQVFLNCAENGMSNLQNSLLTGLNSSLCVVTVTVRYTFTAAVLLCHFWSLEQVYSPSHV